MVQPKTNPKTQAPQAAPQQKIPTAAELALKKSPPKQSTIEELRQLKAKSPTAAASPVRQEPAVKKPTVLVVSIPKTKAAPVNVREYKGPTGVQSTSGAKIKKDYTVKPGANPPLASQPQKEKLAVYKEQGFFAKVKRFFSGK